MNKSEKAAVALSKKIDYVFGRLSASIQDEISAGVSVNDAVNNAVKHAGLVQFLQNNITVGVEGLIYDMGGQITNGPALRKWWLNNVWKSDDMSLSARINDLARMADIKEGIRISLREGESWKKMARSLADENLTKADLAQHISELTGQARRVLQGNYTAMADYKRALKKSMTGIEDLRETGMAGGRLKWAYKDVIAATEKMEQSAIDKSIEHLVAEKARSNAERIAVTEMSKAYAQQNYIEVVGDDQVIGIGYDLSAEHDIEDICDFHTSVDLFDLGPGRYPLDNLPEYPFHPRCMCTMYSVYSGEASKKDNGAAKEWLADKSEEERASLLGVAGAKEFDKDPSSWEENLRGYNGHKDIEDLMERKKF